MAVSKKISALPSLAGAQTGSDLLPLVDVSQPAPLENVKSTLDLFFGNVPSRSIFNPPATATPTVAYFAARTPADTALTGDTEAVGIQLGGDASLGTVTRQFTAGGAAFAVQREIVAVAPTYSAPAAETISQAATVAITNQPQAGTNMTLTNAYALWVQAGLTRLDGNFLNSAAARTGTAPPYAAIRTPADTALTASAEAIGLQLGGDSAQASVTRTFATGALATQRELLAVAPTYAFAGASTITTAATFTITAAPAAGTNATITNSYALWVQAGKSQLAGVVTVAPAARTGTAAIVFQVVTPADTALTAGTESILNQFGGSTAQATVTRQFATGALTTQRENLFVAPTYGFVGASTITTAATVAITGAPAAGTNATITNSYALFVQAGMTRLQGVVRVQPGAGATGFMTATGLYFTDVTQRNNTGTSETVLSTVTLEGNFFGTIGDVLIARFDGVVQGASSGSNFFRVYFGGTASGTGGTKIFESTVTNTGIGLTLWIWRWNTTNTVLWSWDAVYDTSATHNRGTIGSLDFTGNLVLESRGISTVDGSNEITNNATAVYKGVTP